MRLTPDGDVALQHRQEPLECRPVSGFDDEVKPASAGGQIEPVAIIDLAAALDDDVGIPCREDKKSGFINPSRIQFQTVPLHQSHSRRHR